MLNRNINRDTESTTIFGSEGAKRTLQQAHDSVNRVSYYRVNADECGVSLWVAKSRRTRVKPHKRKIQVRKSGNGGHSGSWIRRGGTNQTNHTLLPKFQNCLLGVNLLSLRIANENFDLKRKICTSYLVYVDAGVCVCVCVCVRVRACVR